MEKKPPFFSFWSGQMRYTRCRHGPPAHFLLFLLTRYLECWGAVTDVKECVTVRNRKKNGWPPSYSKEEFKWLKKEMNIFLLISFCFNVSEKSSLIRLQSDGARGKTYTILHTVPVMHLTRRIAEKRSGCEGVCCRLVWAAAFIALRLSPGSKPYP